MYFLVLMSHINIMLRVQLALVHITTLAPQPDFYFEMLNRKSH